MKRGGKTFICLLGCVALALAAKAITGDPTSVKHGETTPAKVATSKAGDNASPYDAIVERNVFDLKDPPDTNVVTVESNAPPPNVELTGIMSVFGKKQALFMVQKVAIPGKPPDPAVSYILAEGQRQDGLEVLDIDQKGKKVKIKNDGLVSTITFVVPKAGPGGGKNEPGGRGQPGRPGFPPNMNPNAGTTPLPTRPLRPAGFSQFSPQGGANPNPGVGGYNPSAANAVQGAYGGGYNTGGASAVGYNQGQQQQAAGPTPEEQVALALAQQTQHQDAIAAGRYPSLPGFPGLTPQPGQDIESGQQQSGNPNPTPSLPSALRPRVGGSFAPPVP